MPPFCRSLLLVTLLVAGTRPVQAQRCPPNSHPKAVAIPGNLRTAQCFCDRGFESVGGVCTPVRRPANRPALNDPLPALVAPLPFR